MDKAMKCRYLYASVWNSGDYPAEEMIQKCKHILIRPFFIPLKRILTDIFLAKMVHKIVEDSAPLRSDL